MQTWRPFVCIRPAQNSVHKDTEGTSCPCTQTDQSRDAPTCTEPRSAPKRWTPCSAHPSPSHQPTPNNLTLNCYRSPTQLARCVTPHARIAPSPEMRDYSIHPHVYLCLLSYRLHSSSIRNPSHKRNGPTVFPSLSKLSLRLNKPTFRSSGSISERIRCVVG